MAEETPTTPSPAVEPPKANPLGKPVAPGASPIGQTIRRPTLSGALRPGVKLPPKPALAGGLKLPPKPASPLKTVSTASPLKPGLKMPAAPAAPVLKSGLKLPTKPVIRKPGSGLTPVKPPAPAAAAPAPAAPAPAPAAPAPVAPAAQAPVAPVAQPQKPVAAPVVAKPVAAPVAAPVAKPVAVAVAGDALTTLKAVTKNLKSLTSPIPQQAILHKTGIIAEPVKDISDAQKQAAKSKTSRISLSTAVGAAPVKNDGAPMKTIRIKRPVDLPADGPATASQPAKVVTATVVAPPQPAATPEPPAAPAAAAESVTATQRKTLKISRPAGLGVRPAGKFGVKKPTAPTSAPAAAAAPAASADAAPVADIPDIPDMPAVSSNVPAFAPAQSKETVADVPAFVAMLGMIVQVAACLVMGAVAWFLYQDSLIPVF